MFKIIEQSQLSAAIAEEFFGWKWLSYIGLPTRDHPNYPEECRVRQFFPPETLARQEWKDHLAKKQVQDADGTEPLDYCYCSSAGPAVFPSYATDLNDFRAVEKDIVRRGLWAEYETILLNQLRAKRRDGSINVRRVLGATAKTRCIAALAAIGSKYVTEVAAK